MYFESGISMCSTDNHFYDTIFYKMKVHDLPNGVGRKYATDTMYCSRYP